MGTSILSEHVRGLLGQSTRRAMLRGIGGAGVIAANLAPGRAFAQTPASSSPGASVVQWQMRGDVMEACRCAVTCPCNFGSDPTQVPCGAIVAWHIQDGAYGETKLNDLNVIAYLQIPGNAFHGGWTLGYYFDQRATPPQLEALEAIFSGKAGGWPAVLSALVAHPLSPKQGSIQFEISNGNVRVTAPGFLEVGTERVPNPIPGQPPLDLEVANLAVPFYTGTVDVRRSTTLKLTAPDLSFDYAGRSALLGRFDYRNA